MKNFFFLILSLICVSVKAQQNQLYVPTSSVNFGEVLLDDLKFDSIVVRNVTGFAINYSVSIIQNYVPPVNNNAECGDITDASPILVQSSNKPFSGLLNPGEKFIMYVGFNPKAYNIKLFQGNVTVCPPKSACYTYPDCNAYQTVDGLGKYFAEVVVSQTTGVTFSKTIPISGNAVSQITQIEEIDKHEDLIFPNPTENFLYITDGNADFEIYSTSGILIKTGQTTNKEVDVTDLNSGLYTIHLNTKMKRTVSKFVKN